MAIESYKGVYPEIGKSSFVHPSSVIIGNVKIGEHCFIGPGVILRGDYDLIYIGDECNVQDNCVFHNRVWLEKRCHIGHAAIIHGAHLGKEVFVGMAATVLDGSVLHDQSAVAAHALVLENTDIPTGKIAMGVPAKRYLDISEELRDYINKGIETYKNYTKEYLLSHAQKA